MPEVVHVHRPGDGERESRQRGRSIAELAARQHGVVARWQLREIGDSDDLIDGRIARSQLIAVHRGVYAVGRRPLTAAGQCMAGVLAGGADAALSFRPASWMWGLDDSRGRAIHVTVPRNRRSRNGLVFHRTVLPSDERTLHDAIPITTVARTVLDAAGIESDARLRQMIAVAEARGLADSPSLPVLLKRYPCCPGRARLVRILGSATAEGVARKELELRFAEFLDEIGAPQPLKNERIRVASGDTLIVDCIWPEVGLVVELDSRRHHADWEAAERDRERDAALVAIGLRVLRITWRRLHHQRAQLACELRAALLVDSRLPSLGR